MTMLMLHYLTGDSSLTSRLGDATLQVLGNPLIPVNQNLYDELLAWAADVRDNVFSDLQSIHAYMTDSTIPGAITLCSTAFKSKWASNRAEAFPVDDRQYYYPITTYLSEKMTFQSQGVK